MVQNSEAEQEYLCHGVWKQVILSQFLQKMTVLDEPHESVFGTRVGWFKL